MYHPTSRVLAVLEWLQSRPKISGAELAERLETDVRTVRRYILKLQDVGIPIESTPGRYGGYRLRPGFRLPPLIFSEDEAIAVMLGLIGSSWLQLSLPKDSVESTLSKITRVLPKITRDRVESLANVSIVTLDLGGARVPTATLLDLSQAVVNRSCVRLEYGVQELTQRIVEPYGVTGIQGRWYMVGFCRLRKALRLFRLDRIRSFDVLSEQFEPPKDFSTGKYIREHMESQPWKIHLQFDATLEEIGRVFGDLGEITRVGHSYEYVGPTDDLDFMARTLLFCGLSFRVIGPPELKQAFYRIADKAKSLADN
jgi:predicted DNA-binding transcriptional regulator YafY